MSSLQFIFEYHCDISLTVEVIDLDAVKATLIFLSHRVADYWLRNPLAPESLGNQRALDSLGNPRVLELLQTMGTSLV